ncbi:c-type cytochrome [Caulobacter sp. NIBR2454]|uniref:c-type cytochrome n=1 Tax=Caulobacter sp. NIBR2454 TaxID=3015996 RepID=UPI0022B61C7A|nr:c-type cytochrome [Caulobacter sp. NIBR2454]
MKRVCAILIGMSLCACDGAKTTPRAIAGADPGAGRAAMERVGCGACHQIPGVRWPQGKVGPSLEGFADRALIAGQLPNQPQTLAAFIRNAPALSPNSGMPPMPVTEEEARDIAAYLYTLDAR